MGKNQKSMAAVHQALITYNRLKDGNADMQSPDENMTDFITDLMHYCDKEGHDFDALVMRCRMHHDEEE